jgi:DNA adenine methylase
MARRAMAAKDYKGLRDSGQIVPAEKPKEISKSVETMSSIEAYIKVVKLVKEEQKVTGVVLEPDTYDAQQTILKSEIIMNAAHKYLAGYNKGNKIGVQHSDFKKSFELCESAIAPIDFSLGDKIIKKGSWYIVLKILDSKIWEKVKKGEIAGFSIGGKAKIKKLEKIQEVA